MSPKSCNNCVLKSKKKHEIKFNNFINFSKYILIQSNIYKIKQYLHVINIKILMRAFPFFFVLGVENKCVLYLIFHLNSD